VVVDVDMHAASLRVEERSGGDRGGDRGACSFTAFGGTADVHLHVDVEASEELCSDIFGRETSLRHGVFREPTEPSAFEPLLRGTERSVLVVGVETGAERGERERLHLDELRVKFGKMFFAVGDIARIADDTANCLRSQS
jgi:hypothetical protein